LAKAILWITTDTELRKLGERTGLDTLVFLTVNDEYWVSRVTTRRRS
jgi:hypothetical protein